MNSHSWLDVFLVVKEDQFFARSKSGTIWGTIYFQIGDSQFFPGKGWTDMVAAFVAAWLEALVRVTNGTEVNKRVHFFDGPFAVDFSVALKGQVGRARPTFGLPAKRVERQRYRGHCRPHPADVVAGQHIR